MQLARRLLELLSEQVHEVLHKVALAHQQVLAYVHTVTLQLVFLKQDLKKLGICLLVGLFDPLF